MSTPVELTNKMCKASKVIEDITLWLSGTLLVLNTVVIIFAVFTRYVLKSSFMWTEELARFLLIASVMFGASAALKNGDHMTIGIIEKYAPRRLNAILEVTKTAVSLFIFAVMSYQGCLFAAKAWRTTTLGLGIPRAVPLLAVPVGMAFLFVQHVLMQAGAGSKQNNQ